MFHSARLCLHQLCRHQTVCRKVPAIITTALPRCPQSAIHRHPHPSVSCLHTQQRLCEDQALSVNAGGSGGSEGGAGQVTGNEGGSGLGFGQSSEGAYIASSGDALVFNGVPYDRIPIVHIKATTNNTIVSLTDHRGIMLKTVSGGTEGFKNARKGTTVAGQTIGSAAAKAALDNGIKQVRVMVKGIGPGRQTSIKGLELGGLDIISITDRTGVPLNGDKPRKAKRR